MLNKNITNAEKAGIPSIVVETLTSMVHKINLFTDVGRIPNLNDLSFSEIDDHIDDHLEIERRMSSFGSI